MDSWINLLVELLCKVPYEYNKYSSTNAINTGTLATGMIRCTLPSIYRIAEMFPELFKVEMNEELYSDDPFYTCVCILYNIIYFPKLTPTYHGHIQLFHLFRALSMKQQVKAYFT